MIMEEEDDREDVGAKLEAIETTDDTPGEEVGAALDRAMLELALLDDELTVGELAADTILDDGTTELLGWPEENALSELTAETPLDGASELLATCEMLERPLDEDSPLLI